MPAVNMSLSYTSTELATEYGRNMWPLLLAGVAVAYAETPPPEAAASAYSQICEDIASVQTRILQLIGTLTPAKLDAPTADSIQLVDNIIRILHSAPVSANTNREMLVSARQILAAGLKAPPDDQLNIHVRSKILDLLKDGSLFSRQRVDTHQYIARQVVIDVTLLARKHLSITQLENILDVFTSDLQNEHLPLTIQIRVSELVMRLLEHLTAFLRLHQRSIDPSTVKPLFCKCLMALLAKIDSIAHHVRPLTLSRSSSHTTCGTCVHVLQIAHCSSCCRGAPIRGCLLPCVCAGYFCLGEVHMRVGGHACITCAGNSSYETTESVCAECLFDRKSDLR